MEEFLKLEKNKKTKVSLYRMDTDYWLNVMKNIVDETLFPWLNVAAIRIDQITKIDDDDNHVQVKVTIDLKINAQKKEGIKYTFDFNNYTATLLKDNTTESLNALITKIYNRTLRYYFGKEFLSTSQADKQV